MFEVDIQSKYFQQKPVLSGVQFTLAEKEIIALVGPSGAGKTTLLNIIAGLDQNYHGSVGVDQSVEPLKLTYMFQEPRLLPWRTVLDNVLLVGDSQAGDRERAVNLLGKVGLNGSENLFPSQLSGGMQRRASLARAFFTKPKLVLMDEPFVSLDAPAADLLRTELLNMWQASDASVLLVTHDLNEALSLSDRVIFFSKSPAKIILEHKVSSPRRLKGQQVAAAQAALLLNHPYLLNGLR